MNLSKDQNTELFRAMYRVRRAWCSITPCKTLSKSQFATLLLILHRSDPENCKNANGGTGYITLTALAAEMQQSLPALSQRVRLLEEMGYVERVPEPTDRRVMGLRLTPEGLCVMTEAKEKFDLFLTQALEQLGHENAGKLIELLIQLADIFEDRLAHKTEGDCNEE